MLPHKGLSKRLLALALLVMPAVASGTTFALNPVQVTLSNGARTGLITVKNQSDEPLRVQVTGFRWGENPDGQMALSEAEDLVFFPAMLTLPAGASRKLRIGTHAPPGDVERTYRVFVEELPPLSKDDRGGVQIKVLLRMGVPVFVVPAKPRAEARVEDLTIAGRKIRFRLRNPGNAHFRADKVRIHGVDKSGVGVFDQALPGWYVLAGGERVYEAELPAGLCVQLARLSVAADTDAETAPASATIADFTSQCVD